MGLISSLQGGQFCPPYYTIYLFAQWVWDDPVCWDGGNVTAENSPSVSPMCVVEWLRLYHGHTVTPTDNTDQSSPAASHAPDVGHSYSPSQLGLTNSCAERGFAHRGGLAESLYVVGRITNHGILTLYGD